MKAGSEPRGGAAESWRDRLTFGALCGVLLAWVIAGVHEAAVMEIPPPGKKGGLDLLPSAATAGSACLGSARTGSADRAAADVGRRARSA